MWDWMDCMNWDTYQDAVIWVILACGGDWWLIATHTWRGDLKLHKHPMEWIVEFCSHWTCEHWNVWWLQVVDCDIYMCGGSVHYSTVTNTLNGRFHVIWDTRVCFPALLFINLLSLMHIQFNNGFHVIMFLVIHFMCLIQVCAVVHFTNL